LPASPLFAYSDRTSDVERRHSLLPLPAVVPELTIHSLPSIRTPNALQHGFAGLSPAGLTSHSSSSLVPPSSVHTARNILVSITCDSPINTPGLASPKPGGSGPLALHLYSRLCVLQLPTDRLPIDVKACQRAIMHHSSGHSRTRFSPPLGAV
jgi:hypothetical protein